jgi:hypothetical protein
MFPVSGMLNTASKMDDRRGEASHELTEPDKLHPEQHQGGTEMEASINLQKIAWPSGQ